MDMDKQKILNYSTKDELQDILEEHGMPFSSPKPKLIENIIQNENIFSLLMDAAKVCSLGEITNALFEVGGQYRRNM